MKPVVSLRGASLQFGKRTLWEDLDLDIRPGEFFAVLGPNGSGKTSFLKVLLGLQDLRSGSATLGDRPVERGAASSATSRSRNRSPRTHPCGPGTWWGLAWTGTAGACGWAHRRVNRRIDELLELVGATDYAKVPVGQLSGGEQQRLRVAQALATDPQVLLCDEPLLSLDLHHQQAVSALINKQCHDQNSAVVFVTHEINPIIDYVDRVLYLAGGRFRVGTPEEVMTTEVLSELYGSHVEVIHANGRIVVVGLPDATTHHHADVHATAGEVA